MNQRISFRSLLALCAAVICVLYGVCFPASAEANYTKFTRRETSIFDTEISFIGFASSEEAFERAYAPLIEMLEKYDHIFDAYNAYGDLHNLYYVNRHAAQEPVEIPDELFDLISWCKAQWNAGMRTTNIAMGAVLTIWHEYREAGLADPNNAKLPPMEDLIAASGHTNFDDVILDDENKTVYFSDPLLTLDIGAVAKGWAADAVVPYLYEALPSFLLSLGGNVYAGNAPMDGRTNWAVGVQDPQANALTVAVGGTEILDVVDVHDLTVVTSGDYWRYYMVDGERYHHIIDPDTLMPSRQMLSVTVVCESSALADFLSTTLFVLSYEDGLALVESLNGVEAMWVLPDGSVQASSGMSRFARKIN
ncbi:MAG: FAD:protein FMN transferase [Clostridia bacterium]|nr:FAD:protein FMN transferase [Clostridia bacterium]